MLQLQYEVDGVAEDGLAERRRRARGQRRRRQQRQRRVTQPLAQRAQILFLLYVERGRLPDAVGSAEIKTFSCMVIKYY